MTFINDAQAILRKQGYKVMIAISNENPEAGEREHSDDGAAACGWYPDECMR